MAAPSIPVSRTSLPRLAETGIAVPSYAAEQLEPRIVHIGVGGFHRAHMAAFTHELAESGSTWGIRGLGLMPADAAMRDALRPQDCLYTLTEKGDDRFDTRVIGSIVDYVFAAGDVAAAVAAVADPRVCIVSLTITEAGYAATSAGGRSTFDDIVACLDARRRAAAGPVTIVSCDNLRGNGDVCRQSVLNVAGRTNVEVARWIEANCSFPNSMVDRITPSTTEADRQYLRDTFGVEDRWPVVSEPYRQWVIEDDFVAGRPEWERVGVQFTDDVQSWELYKLRFLNAAHSALASLSALAGIVHVDEALANNEVRRYLTSMLHTEVLPSLPGIPGHPREDYIDAVLARFTSTGVRDQIHRLCIDGTAKYSTFVMPIVEWNLEHGGPIAATTLAIAGWARYLATTPPDEQAFDARGERARAAAASFIERPLSFLDDASIVPSPISHNERFRQEFADAAHRLATAGALRAMGELSGRQRLDVTIVAP